MSSDTSKTSYKTAKGLPKNAQFQVNGNTVYVYFAYSYRVNGKKKQERDYLGKISDDGTTFIPNDQYRLHNFYKWEDRPAENWKDPVRREKAAEINAGTLTSTSVLEDAREETENIPPSVASVGATALAAAILEKNGMREDLVNLLGDSKIAAAVSNLAMHAAITSDATYCDGKESQIQIFIGKGCPTSPRASELLQKLGARPDLPISLGQARAKRVKSGDLLAVDGTELPSSSKNINLTALGKTKEKTFDTQINISILVNTVDGNAICYRTYAGCTNDISTLDDQRKLWDEIGLKDKHVTVAADRGYLSKEEAVAMAQSGYSFIFGAKVDVKYIKNIIDTRNCEFYKPRNWIAHEQCYGLKTETTIEANGNEVRIFAFIFRSSLKQEKEMDELTDTMTAFERKWNRTAVKNRDKLRADKCYPLFKEVGGLLIRNDEEFDEACYLKGFFALTGNVNLTTRQAIEHYRERNDIEVDFKLLFNHLLQSSRVHSTVAFNGLIFVTFVALSIMTYLNAAMEATIPNERSPKGYSYIKDLYTIRELFKELQRIQLTAFSDGRLSLVNVLERDKRLVKALGLEGLFDDPERVLMLLSLPVKAN